MLRYSRTVRQVKTFEVSAFSSRTTQRYERSKESFEVEDLPAHVWVNGLRDLHVFRDAPLVRKQGGMETDDRGVSDR